MNETCTDLFDFFSLFTFHIEIPFARNYKLCRFCILSVLFLKNTPNNDA